MSNMVVICSARSLVFIKFTLYTCLEFFSLHAVQHFQTVIGSLTFFLQACARACFSRS